MIEQIEHAEDEALFAVLADIKGAGNETIQNRAIDRYLKLATAIAIKNGEFNPVTLDSFAKRVGLVAVNQHKGE